MLLAYHSQFVDLFSLAVFICVVSLSFVTNGMIARLSRIGFLKLLYSLQLEIYLGHIVVLRALSKVQDFYPVNEIVVLAGVILFAVLLKFATTFIVRGCKLLVTKSNNF